MKQMSVSVRLVVALVLGIATMAMGPTPGGSPSVAAASRILFQVTSQSWPQRINSWIPHPAGSWMAGSGALTNTGNGRKVCDYDEGTKYCRYQAVIMAPYRPTTGYAIEAAIRFGGPKQTCNGLAGIVFRAHGTSVNPAPWLIATGCGILQNCPGPRLSGHVALGICGYTGNTSSRPPGFITIVRPAPPNVPGIWSYQDDGGWHIWRVEVRARHYRLFIDGKPMERVMDKRARTDLGARFGFFATSDPALGTSKRIWIRRITVVALQPSAG